MAQRKTQFAPGEYYHIYNRGCNKERIFFEDGNYLFLLNKLGEGANEHHISVLVYCLMPNHYHFLMRQDGETSVAVLMQEVFNSYTKAINRKYHRSGTLFQGPYKSTHVDKEEYLLHLCRYIHRNPLDGGLVKNIEEWDYSNYLECIGRRNRSLYDPGFIAEYDPQAHGSGSQRSQSILLGYSDGFLGCNIVI